MLDRKTLQKGHWLTSVGDFVVTFAKHPFAWIAVGLYIARGTVISDIELSGISDEQMLKAAGLWLASGCFMFLSVFMIFRKMNAELLNRVAIQQPLVANVELAEGAAYRFDIEGNDIYGNLLDRIDEKAEVERKLKVTKKKSLVDRDEDAEVTKDLIAHYDQKLQHMQMKIDALAERYHVPTMELTFQIRINNPDRHRLARILDIGVDFEQVTHIWSFGPNGTTDLEGDGVDFPIQLKPGEAFVGTHRCLMKPNSSLTQAELANFLNRQHRRTFSASLKVHCDDTYDELAITVLPVRVSLAPLRDELETHWFKSEFL